MNDITRLTALELAQEIRQHKLSVSQCVTAYLDNIEKYNKTLNCFNTVCAEYALKRADQVQKAIDSGELNGELAGVPIAVKDNICTKGILTTCSSRMLRDYVPTYNATVIDIINEAGMIVLGKLNMDEFAMGSTTETSYFSAVRNPWNTDMSAGGSSGGCAAAVAACLAPVTLGSDTGGSVRQPASMCGVTGLKPTYGSVSRYGLIAYASSLDQIGILGKNAVDCAALYAIINGNDERDATCVGNKGFDYEQATVGNTVGVRIAMPQEYLDSGLDPEVKSAVLAAADTFKRFGARVEYISLPVLEYAIPAYYITACAEASSNLARYDGIRYGHRSAGAKSVDELFILSRTEGFGDEVKRRIMLGSFVLSAGWFDRYYKKALKARQLIKDGLNKVFESFDFILSPVAPSIAPRLGESLNDPAKMYLSDIYTVTANLAGIPSLAVPCGFSDSGMPIGLQLMGKADSEAQLLSAAYAFQSASDLHRRTPEFDGGRAQI